jgi:hypothetical protein
MREGEGQSVSLTSAHPCERRFLTVYGQKWEMGPRAGSQFPGVLRTPRKFGTGVGLPAAPTAGTFRNTGSVTSTGVTTHSGPVQVVVLIVHGVAALQLERAARLPAGARGLPVPGSASSYLPECWTNEGAGMPSERSRE